MMQFIHGTTQGNIKENGFKLFDYCIDANGVSSLPFIKSGADQEGPAIYAFHNDENSIKNASIYASGNESYAYIISINIEESQLMNNRDADEIGIDDLIDVVNCFIDKRRSQVNYSKDVIDDVINGFYDNFDDINVDDVNNELESNGSDFRIEEDISPHQFDNYDDWFDEVDEAYQVNEPCSYIADEGGAYNIVSYAINKSDNLWGTIKSIWNSVAVNNTGVGMYSYNKTFQESMMDVLSNRYDLTCALVNNGSFAVIFDTNAIDIDKVIDLNANIKSKISKDLNSKLLKKESSKVANKKNVKFL